MNLVEEITKIAKEVAKTTGYEVNVRDNTIVLSSSDSPLKLEIKVSDSNVEFNLIYEGLEEYIEDLIDSGEDVRESIEYEVADIKNIAMYIKSKLSSRGIRIFDRIKEAELDIYDIVEEHLI